MKLLIRTLAKGSWVFRTLLLFVTTAAVVTLGGWPIVRAYDAGRVDVLEARENGYAETAALDIQTALHEIFGDLHVAAHLPAMRRFLSDESVPDREQTLAGAFKDILEAYGRYSQIRLLDLSGREVVRVNDTGGRATVVPHGELQDKSDRYYFKAAAALDYGQTYLSPIDLNVENGKVEVPWNPTLRVATPVFDDLGGKKGVLVLNVRGDDLLERFHAIVRGEPLHQAMLLDHDGYWLSNGADGNEWGFMFGRSDATFGNPYPDEWRTIAAGDRGVLRTGKGLFAYASVYPPASVAVTAAPPFVSTAGDRQAYLKVVLLVPQQSLLRLSLAYLPLGRALVATVYVLLLLLSGLVAYISLNLMRARAVERAAAREIEDLYERAPCGYHSVDRNGLVVRMNQTELNWLGYRRDEVVGRMKITDLMKDDARKMFASSFPRLLESGYVGNINFDFVRKDGSLLPVSVNASAVRDDAGNFVMSRSTVFDATERRDLERELMRQASTDPLTGVWNRRYFFELAAHELSRSMRTHTPLSLLLIDLDEFKKINDQCGHDAGDAVLKAMTAACASTLRTADVFARIGGEEFVVLLPDTDAAQAQIIAERLREQMARVDVPRAPAQPLRFTVSIGIASLGPMDHADGIDAIMRRADGALYQAKNAGRNRVRASA